MRLGLFSLVMWLFLMVGARGADRPNILFVFADDWGRYASCYAELDAKPTANSVIKTPHIDSVGTRGVRFRNAFVNAPSCTVSAGTESPLVRRSRGRFAQFSSRAPTGCGD